MSSITAALAAGRAIPSGVYDLVHHQGGVLVGIDHETAEFAVERSSRWWKHCGKKLSLAAHELLITADGGESLGVRNTLWKKARHPLVNEAQLTITVAHDPSAPVPRGTRSNTASFPAFPSSGVLNHSPLWKPVVHCSLIRPPRDADCTSPPSRTARHIRQASSSPTPNARPSLSSAIPFMASGTPSSTLKTLPHSRTKPRHMGYTGIHLRRSHQESERWLLLRPAACRS